MNVGIVAQRGNDRAASLAADVRTDLESSGVTVVVDEATAEHIDRDSDRASGAPVERMADCDLVVSIGGDGTFLYAARGAATTPIMGVNLGEVGFLNAVPPEEAIETVRTEVERVRDCGRARTRSVARVGASGDGWTVPPAINEIAVLGPQRGHGHGITATVTVNGSEFTSGRVDGVLIATPTGSTAYNLSEGGPLVHPGVDALVVTAMAPRDGLPPLVVDGGSEIEITLTEASKAVVASDGRVGETVTPTTTLRVRQADDPLNIAGPPLDFFAGLGKLD